MEEKKEHKYKIGDLVVYEELVGIVQGLGTRYISGEPCYDLVSRTNSELSCTADESKCEPYDGEEIDESRALDGARISGFLITKMVDGLTDKHFRDGNH